MAESVKNDILQVVEEHIGKIKNKDFNVYFFVLDTKGNPSGSLEYIYQTALILHNKGYRVSMLHNDKEFVGVGGWLGEEYANLKHMNTELENVEVSPSDFLFIPEIFASVAVKTKDMPCKRILIVQNYNHLAEFMPVTASMYDLRLSDIITTTKVQEGILHDYFPGMKTHIVSPCIKKMFRDNDQPRKLVVNVVSKTTTDVNRIIKPFYWKYPIYKWISFRDLRGLSQDEFCEALRDGAITIWIDDDTNFGYSALEAMRCGTILLAKQPSTFTDWNIDEEKKSLTDACLWFSHVDDVPDMLASVIRTWTLDAIPAEIFENQKKLNDRYTVEGMEKEIEHVYEKTLFEGRISEFDEFKAQAKSKNNATKKQGE